MTTSGTSSASYGECVSFIPLSEQLSVEWYPIAPRVEDFIGFCFGLGGGGKPFASINVCEPSTEGLGTLIEGSLFDDF